MMMGKMKVMKSVDRKTGEGVGGRENKRSRRRGQDGKSQGEN